MDISHDKIKKLQHSHRAKLMGSLLLEYRNKSSMLQYELAKRLNMTGQFLGRIEKGEVQCPERSLARAIHILNIPDEKILKAFITSAKQDAKDLMQKSARG